jgi:hypothetical protein
MFMYKLDTSKSCLPRIDLPDNLSIDFDLVNTLHDIQAGSH